MVKAFELADWDRCEELRALTKVSEDVLSQSYVKAVEWAKLVSQ
jgi:c-di-GMP-related signal transduction protein